jgi:hypothetical protein
MSGAAKRRRRRIRQILSTAETSEQRWRDGADVIDTATVALKAVILLAATQKVENHLRGDELACLLDLIHAEIAVGRAVQCGDESAFEQDAA